MPPYTRPRQPSWSNNSGQPSRENDRFSESTIGYAVSSDSEQISSPKSFGNSSTLADLQAQLRAASLSNAPFVPLAADCSRPTVIPATLNWREHPRWKPLLTTPTRAPNPDDPFVPDRSPTPARSDTSETEDVNTDSPGSFIHRRRRKEHVHRPPIWYVQNHAGSVPDYDPFYDSGSGSHQYPKFQTSRVPFSGFRQSLSVRTTLLSPPSAIYPPGWEDELLQPYVWLPKAPTPQTPSDDQTQPGSEHPSAGPSTVSGTQSPNLDGQTGSHLPAEEVDCESSESIPVPSLNSFFRDIHTVAGDEISPGSLVMCLYTDLSHQWDEFDLKFGDAFTVLRVFDDGWALCMPLQDPQPCIEQDRDSDRANPNSRVNTQGTNTESASDISTCSLSDKTRFNAVIISVISKVSLTVSPKTKFLPLLAVTLTTNFGSILRDAFATFGKLDFSQPLGKSQLIGAHARPARTASLDFQARGYGMETVIHKEVRHTAVLGYSTSPIQESDILPESLVGPSQSQKAFKPGSLTKTFVDKLARKLTGRERKRGEARFGGPRKGKV